MQKFWTKINRIVAETEDIVSYFLDCPEGFTWEEGAHTHLGLKGFDAGSKPDRSRVRHMSMATLPHEAVIRITTRVRANGSPFKQMLGKHVVGDEVALFKTHSNIPLKRSGRRAYLLSQGVGLATFRPHVLAYLENADNIPHMHSLTVDATETPLFADVFTSLSAKKFSAQYVKHRNDYYKMLQELAEDTEGDFYIVGSDAFLLENIAFLQAQGVGLDQIQLDKRERQIEQFKPSRPSTPATLTEPAPAQA